MKIFSPRSLNVDVYHRAYKKHFFMIYKKGKKEFGDELREGPGNFIVVMCVVRVKGESEIDPYKIGGILWRYDSGRSDTV